MRDCLICENSKKVAAYVTVEGHAYLRCSGCGLIYVDQIQPPDQLYHSYDGGFWKSLRRKITAPFRGFSQVKNFQESMDRAHRIFEFASSKCDPPKGQPAYLDIGCNKGFNLAAAIAHSWNVYGIETVPELTVPFRNEFKAFASQIIPKGFSEAQTQFQDATFDLVTAIDVIEHFEAPRQDLSNIRRILKPGGLFVLQTPDGDDPDAEKLRERWGALKPLEHLHIFNRNNLEKLGKKLGFQEIQFFEPFERADGNFVAIMKK